MLTPKENALRMIYNEDPEYIPITLETHRLVGLEFSPALDQPLAPGDSRDGFGILWHVDAFGAIPDNSSFLFEDIEDWEKYVKLPDLDAIDFKAGAERELATVDRDRSLLVFPHFCGIWERFVAFMGFENALIALIEEPEACHDLLEYLADYRIDVASRIIDAYGIDIYRDFSDYATAKSLFMSPELWRDVIKPHQRKIVEAVTARDVIFEQHYCGHCEEIVGDFVEMGARCWQSAQPMNDIAGMEERYAGKLTIVGGWDSGGLPGTITATDGDVRAETRRCIEEYGRSGSFILEPLLMSAEGNSLAPGAHDPRVDAVVDEWDKCRMLV